MFKTKIIRPVFVMLSILIFLFITYNPCFAFKPAFTDHLEITGYLRNDSSIRLDDNKYPDKNYLEKGDVTLSRTWLQVEADWDATDYLRVFGSYRGWYDAALDFNDDLRDGIAESERDDFKKESELREGWVQYNTQYWSIRAGKQQIIWGESDGLRMADIINPLDYSWNYFYPSWEDIRIPLWTAKFNYMIPHTDHSFEFIYLPNAFDNGFEGSRYAPAGANWSIPGMPQNMLDAMDASQPEKSLKNSEYGLRYRTMLGSWDVTVFDFYGRNRDPIFRADWLERMGNGSQELFQYRWVNKLGGTFNVFNAPLKAVFRGECVYTFDEPFNPVDVAQTPMPFYQKDTVAYMLGFDRPTMIPWLNSRQSFFISGQIFQKYALNTDEAEVATPGLSGDDHQTILTLVVNTSYFRAKFTPQIFLLYDFSGESWVQPKFTYLWGGLDQFSFTVGANIMMACNDRQAYFGPFKNDDEIFATLKFEY